MYMNSTEDKFVIWSDGSFTSMGIDVSSTTLYNGTDKLLIKDPVSVIFATEDIKNEEASKTVVDSEIEEFEQIQLDINEIKLAFDNIIFVSHFLDFARQNYIPSIGFLFFC